MKKRTVGALLSIVLLAVLLLSGCANQTSNNANNTPSALPIHDECTITATGGEYDLADERVHFSVPENATLQDVAVTLDSVPDPPYDSDIVLANCYTFGPEGTVFADNVSLTMQYNPSKIPADTPADILHLFVLSGTEWMKIQGCVADTAHQTVTGPITHFSTIGIGYIPSEKLEHTREHNESQKNTSASITFDVPVQLYEYETNFTPWENYPDQIDYSFYCGAYIAWDPSPYVRYYELHIHFNGNPKPAQSIFSSCDYQEWGKAWCTLYPYGWTETTTRYLGNLPVPDERGYIGTYDNARSIIGSDKHGMTLANLHSDFDYVDGYTRAQINDIEQEMREFVASYTAGWTYTVKNVS